ncbi:MAG TPA: SGNH/GDSL hydrolase family protein [Candidatus Gallimonas intestinavium]|uniref:SGNH/GDSL hydrolase family protein n=1 Tax=Candidatus Gallimonas intestinavium TaxID=2838603 RepID=A0A9D2G4C8_9FIRM|nr:SGNH/GDSL hydrolase family protein [Candidatus Gallimonas intestinavium]
MIKNNDTILFAGDSTTDADKKATFRELGNGYVKLIFHFLRAFRPEEKYYIVNAGVSGNTSRDLLARWEPDVLAKKPDVVFCMIGINDVWRHFDVFEKEDYYVSLEEYERNLEQMAESADNVREFVFVSPFFMEGNGADPMRQMTERYAAVMKKVADRRGLRFVDMQAAFDIFLQHRSGISISWDRVHPGDTGSMIIARRLLEEMGVI